MQSRADQPDESDDADNAEIVDEKFRAQSRLRSIGAADLADRRDGMFGGRDQQIREFERIDFRAGVIARKRESRRATGVRKKKGSVVQQKRNSGDAEKDQAGAITREFPPPRKLQQNRAADQLNTEKTEIRIGPA